MHREHAKNKWKMQNQLPLIFHQKNYLCKDLKNLKKNKATMWLNLA